MSEAPALLALEDIVRVYDGRRVVDGLTLELPAGQVTCLLGPSGCGKTTTLRDRRGGGAARAGAGCWSGAGWSRTSRGTPRPRRARSG
ncbi:MAG: hypothetical protein KatS3mg118_2249 [Paracoccaceae bacterium]|nr:MAG: hypothetical protein KatS3mg118_2249 [Paracoccaceae bacterium]